jgi:dihydropteroate synthase
MGILNVTPDSFSDGGRHIDPEAAVARGVAMAREGADVIDVGGESTRPGSEEVPEDEEIRRVVPVIERLADAVDVPLSIDTRKAAVAREALDAGASILNDVSALGHDPEMLEVVGETGAPVVLVHMKGEPRTMQENPVYEDVVAEVYDWLERRAVELEEAGLDPDALVVDPGIGFGKRPEDNLDLLRSIGDFHGLGRAILVGASRKSFLGAVGAGAGPEERLPGSLAAASLCERSGVQWLRVHDVLETRALLDTLRAVRRGEMPGKRKARRASGRSG